MFPIDQRYDCEKQLQEIKATYELRVYGGMSHGWAIRGDKSDRGQTAAMNMAFDQAVSWFRWHFDGPE
jgi:dienelactone hydrolase